MPYRTQNCPAGLPHPESPGAAEEISQAVTPHSLSRRHFGFGLAALSLTGCTAAAPPARAQLNAVPGTGQRSTVPDFADLAEAVLPAVVNIAVTGEAPQRVPDEFRGTPFERYFRERGRARRVQGAGSGFIIDAAGFVVTNAHVVGNAGRIVVALQDGTEFQARLVGADELTDVALLKIQADRTLTVLRWGSSAAMRVGQWVLAAGNPFGLGGTVTAGIISARGREIGTGPFDDFLQTDAAINPGNSGGPVFNAAGEVVGISTAIYSPSGANAGIGFATPSDLVRPVIEQLRNGGRVERGWLGVSVQDVVPEPGRGAASRGGVLIAGVERGSPAGRAGVRIGDVVTAVNGERIESSRTLVRNVAMVPPGQTVRLTLQRDGRAQEVTVQVGRRPNSQG